MGGHGALRGALLYISSQSSLSDFAFLSCFQPRFAPCSLRVTKILIVGPGSQPSKTGDKPTCQGTVPATLSFGVGGNGTYSIDGLVLSSEFRGNFAAGHVQSTETAAPHGTFIVQANETHLYGSWVSFGSQRLFHWDFKRTTPPPPPPPPCAGARTSAACGKEAAGCIWKQGSCSSRITQQVNVFVGGTKAPWGTTYHCFRVPSSVLLPNGDVVVFVESRIETCGDQAPKDVTMKRSTDSGKTWGPLTLVVGPTHHVPGQLDFSARNPYATLDKNGNLLLSWVNSTVRSMYSYNSCK